MVLLTLALIQSSNYSLIQTTSRPKGFNNREFTYTFYWYWMGWRNNHMENFSIYSKYITWHLKLNDIRNHKLKWLYKTHQCTMLCVLCLCTAIYNYKGARFLNEKLCDTAYMRLIGWVSNCNCLAKLFNINRARIKFCFS